jgi:hypothetical protein
MLAARTVAFAWLLLVSSAASATATTTVVDVATRGVTQRFLYVRPDTPIANIVALPAGGALGVRDDGTLSAPAARCDPVARARDDFAQLGFAVALVDAASDGSVNEFDDVLQVIRSMQARDGVPTWLIGGGSSAAAVLDLAANLPLAAPVGAIFYSAQHVDASRASSLRRPAQVVTHELVDAAAAAALYDALANAPARQRAVIAGGDAGGCGHASFEGALVAFVAATTSFIERNSASMMVAAPDLDQHGLTGTWYEPATSGQGFAFEVYPDMLGAGTGWLSGGWFTFGAAAGGADGQRWYSISGPMPSGAKSAPVTIYRNVGGNFDAAPVTTAESVGTGAIDFWTCDAGVLTYAFADGRAGSIPLSRVASNVECSSTASRPANGDFALSGNWYSPSTSGQGIAIEANPSSNVLWLAWYTYAPSGAASGIAGQRWYTGQGAYTAGERSVAVTLYQTVGGAFDAAEPAAPATTPVGSATLAFSSCEHASLAYAFTAGTNAGLSGTIALQRAGPTPAGCAF